ncbi:MAG: tetratricopeptide repeat protein [Opitutales bacterium]|nr:tetratricopeptide repeat protein [Opitutales bacterium]
MQAEQIRDILLKGLQFQQNQSYQEALQCYDKVLSFLPTQTDALYLKAIIYIRLFRFTEAIELLQKALEQSANMSIDRRSECHAALGSAYQQLKHFEEADQAFLSAIELTPKSADRIVDRAQCLLARGKADEAEKMAQKALKIDPEHLRAQIASAESLFQTWRVLEYISKLQSALKSHPANMDLICQYLMSINYLPDDHLHSAAKEHINIGSTLQPFLRKSIRQETVESSIDPKQELRVGFISPDLKKHSVTFFLLPLLKALKPITSIRTYCYSTVAYEDQITQKVKESSDHFRKLAGSREFEKIHKDQLHLLIDLASHSNPPHFEALVRSPKVVPYYVQWLGYPNTSGFPIFDCRFVDSTSDPEIPEMEPSSERKIRLEPCFLCYEPPEDAPEVEKLPALSGTPFTLGSFNNLNKINSATVELWARLLRKIPNARVLFKTALLSKPSVRERLVQTFGKHGVDPDRLILAERTASMYEHLNTYNKIDLALDPFPYGGTTTTFEALFMGCPVVTLTGFQHRSRVTHSILSALDLEDWVAETPQQYVEIASKTSQKPELLGELRTHLREKLLFSRLCDGDAFAKEFTRACREVIQS